MTTVNPNNIKNKCSTRINQGEISLIIFICLGIRHRMKACLHPSLHQMWVMIVLGPVTGKGWQPTRYIKQQFWYFKDLVKNQPPTEGPLNLPQIRTKINLQSPSLLPSSSNKPCVSLGSCSDQKAVKSCHKLISRVLMIKLPQSV